MPRKRWPNPEALTTAQAAHHLGISPNSLAKARIYGGGPPWHVLFKSAVRYRVADLDAWLAAGRTGHGDLCRRCPHRKADDG